MSRIGTSAKHLPFRRELDTDHDNLNVDKQINNSKIWATDFLPNVFKVL